MKYFASLIAILTVFGIIYTFANKPSATTLNTTYQSNTVSAPVVTNTPVPTPTPSERALRLVAQIYVRSSEKEQKDLDAQFGGDKAAALRDLALRLDQKPELMPLIEAELEKEKNKTVVYPAQDKSLYCTTNSFGFTTTTRCF